MSWICPKCETENPDRLMVCEVCDSPRVVKKKTVRTISLENKDSFCDRRYNAYIRLKGMNLMVFDSDAESFDWEKICREDSIPFSNPIFISCLKREAENGNKDAQVILARCYVRGLGVKKNINDAHSFTFFNNSSAVSRALRSASSTASRLSAGDAPSRSRVPATTR